MRQFSMRDLLLLTALVAVALGWWIDRRNSALPGARFQIEVVDERAFVPGFSSGQLVEHALQVNPDYVSPESHESMPVK